MRLGKVELTPGFLLLAAWLNYVDDQGLLLPVLLSCTLHELGHLTVLHVLKISVKHIRITLVGAEICTAGRMSYLGELAASLAGPGVNLLLALVLCRFPDGKMLAGLNLVLACFNLLPAKGLDGGRALRCLLALWLGPDRGEDVSRTVSWLAAAFVCAVSLWTARMGGNVTLAITTGWLLCAGAREGEKEGIGACQGAWKKVK